MKFKSHRLLDKDVSYTNVLLTILIVILSLVARLDVILTIIPVAFLLYYIIDNLACQRNEGFYIQILLRTMMFWLLDMSLMRNYSGSAKVTVMSLISALMLCFVAYKEKYINKKFKLLFIIMICSFSSLMTLDYNIKSNEVNYEITNEIDENVRNTSLLRLTNFDDANNLLYKKNNIAINVAHILKCIKDDASYLEYIKENEEVTSEGLAVKFMQDINENPSITLNNLYDTGFVVESIEKYEISSKKV